jgi:hypothetical protein
MGDHHFLATQAIVGEPIVVAKGYLETDEYQAVEMHVGLVQVKTTDPDKNGNPNFELVAGAYGIGLPVLGAFDPETQLSEWTMRLDLDAENKTFTSTPGRDNTLAFGFALVKLVGGGYTGWVDQVKLTKPRSGMPTPIELLNKEAKAAAEARNSQHARAS